MAINIFTFKTGTRYFMLELRELVKLTVKGHYTRVYSTLPESPILIDMSLIATETRLPEPLFCRISDNCLVPVTSIRCLDGYTITLRSGEELECGKKYKQQVIEKFNAFCHI